MNHNDRRLAQMTLLITKIAGNRLTTQVLLLLIVHVSSAYLLNVIIIPTLIFSYIEPKQSTTSQDLILSTFALTLAESKSSGQTCNLLVFKSLIKSYLK